MEDSPAFIMIFEAKCKVVNQIANRQRETASMQEMESILEKTFFSRDLPTTGAPPLTCELRSLILIAPPLDNRLFITLLLLRCSTSVLVFFSHTSRPCLTSRQWNLFLSLDLSFSYDSQPFVPHFCIASLPVVLFQQNTVLHRRYHKSCLALFVVRNLNLPWPVWLSVWSNPPKIDNRRLPSLLPDMFLSIAFLRNCCWYSAWHMDITKAVLFMM
ncbi:uncharacterized protein BYT42DRAFT_208305 [Radiomyces spectabilis]|uniref:uncharacterized protein n=1 Tax=Radiomyces spectabilis TaxID=64574 RepID=UPI0022207090|nr:uncharacterized protein BYT42DRAFT_208305 [Radiomyces spectabilis]KAI8391781.1 hypothetical protein BYT42DRAFT_208305 [Radiomyces spectabilis]